MLRQLYVQMLHELGVNWAQLSLGGRDPGVVCYFEIYGNSCAIACDKWDTADANLNFIIASLRNLADLGAARHDRLLREQIRKLRLDAHLPGWCTFYGFKEIPERSLLEKAHRAMVLESHPDRGGSEERMREINLQIAAARDYYSKIA